MSWRWFSPTPLPALQLYVPKLSVVALGIGKQYPFSEHFVPGIEIPLNVHHT
jgi:hypothetical protein